MEVIDTTGGFSIEKQPFIPLNHHQFIHKIHLPSLTLRNSLNYRNQINEIPRAPQDTEIRTNSEKFISLIDSFGN